MKQMKNRLISFLIIFFIASISLISSSPDKAMSFQENDRIQSSILQGTPDLYEDDNSFATSKNIALNSIQERSISSIDDVDYVNFTLDSFYLVDIETSGFSGDTRLWIFNQHYKQFAFDDDSGTGYFSSISGSLKPGIYFLKIDEFGNDDEIESYNLSISATITQDYYEYDDVPAQCVFIELNNRYERSIYPIGDWEYFTFTIPISYNVTLETTGTNGDTVMSIFIDPENEGSSEIDRDDDGGTIPGFSKLTLINLTPGTYYVKVWAWNDASTILNYTLHAIGTSDSLVDSIGPDISLKDEFLDPVSSSGILILAFVEDEISGVDSVHLHYRFNGGSWESTELIYDVPTLYGISVGPFQIGDFFEYYFTAYDTSPSNHMTTLNNGGSNYNFTVTSLDLNDPMEKDDSLNYINSLALNSTTDRRIYPIGDTDYCSFSLDDKYNIEVETSGLSGDTVLYLYYENLSLISYNDNSGVDQFSKIIATLSDGTYLIKIVENGNDATIIDYAISLTALIVHEIAEYQNQLLLAISVLFTLILIRSFKASKKKI